MDSDFFWVTLIEMLHDSRESHVWDINILIIIYQMTYSPWKHPREH